MLCSNSWSGVTNGDEQAAINPLVDIDLDLSTCWGVTHGVAHQIGQSAL
jgi:hypothetical protein